MESKCEFMYDDFSDRLLISCKKSGEKVIGSIKFLNLNIDVGSANKILNVELKKASNFLKSIKINPDILNNLVEANLILKTCRDGYLIYFVLKSEDRVERIPYNIQSVKTPILLR